MEGFHPPASRFRADQLLWAKVELEAHRCFFAMKKGPLLGWGSVRDDINYPEKMGIVRNHEIRIPINQAI